MSIVSSLLGQLSLSPAEKAFRPWWDDFENFIVYSMVIISILVAPGAFLVNGKVLECNRCQGNECCEWADAYCQVGDTTDEKDYNLFYVRSYCENNPSGNLYRYYSDENQNYTYEEGFHIPKYILYFQYFLLGVSVVLIVLDRPFVIVLFRSLNIEQIYKLLVSDDPYTHNIDKKKEIHEIVSVLGSVGSYYLSYLTRTVLSLVASLAMMLYLAFYQVDRDYEFKKAYVCMVHGRMYECSGHATSLYLSIGWLFVALLSLYLLLNVYNLIWIIANGRFSPLEQVMAKFSTFGPVSPCLNSLFFKNRNVKLLLCLLSSSSGLPAPLRALALIDKKLRESLIPTIQVDKIPYGNQINSATPLKIAIQPNSLLEYISDRKDCYTTFSVENGSQIEHFTETCKEWYMNLENNDKSDGTIKISTSLNGLIVGVTQISLHHDGSIQQQTNGAPLQPDEHNITAWQRLN